MKEIYEVKNTLTEDFSFKTNKVLVVQTFVNSLDVRTTALVVQEGDLKAISSKNVYSALGKQTCDGRKRFCRELRWWPICALLQN